MFRQLGLTSFPKGVGFKKVNKSTTHLSFPTLPKGPVFGSQEKSLSGVGRFFCFHVPFCGECLPRKVIEIEVVYWDFGPRNIDDFPVFCCKRSGVR